MAFKTLAISLGKAVSFGTNFIGSGGTAAPGLLAQKINPNILSEFSSQLTLGSVLISGTNGKTTTARILATILKEAGIKTIHNSEGSNLIRGLTSTFIKNSSVTGKVKADLGIFEVDEATVPEAIGLLKPKIIVLNNLFRDQLDRYGEVDKIRRIWEEVLESLPEETTVVLNADDPSIAHLGHKLKNKVVYFGLELKDETFKRPYHAIDVTRCLECNTPLDYSFYYLSHLGEYQCPKCGLDRPTPRVFATSLESKGIQGTKVTLNIEGEKYATTIPSAGLYNLYNTLGAITAALALKINHDLIKLGLVNFKGVFGRLEKIPVKDKFLVVALAKNPVGFNEVLKTIFQTDEKRRTLVAINDLIADGRDISWIWDVDFELMKGKLDNLIISGTRAEDMALRAKYAELGELKLEKSLKKAIEEGLNNTGSGETFYILPTYTAMLEVRKVLSKKGLISHYLKEVK